MKKKTKINFSIALCIVIYIVLQLVIRISDRFYTGNFNGVFSACQFAICLLMIYIDRKKGFITASLLMICSILLLFRIVCIKHIIAPLPGLVNFLIYLLTLIIITKQIHVREQAAVTDMLTGLSNRRGIFWLLKQKTEDGQPFSVICLTLVNYKMIRDNFGNDYGEMLIKHIADRIVNVVDREGSVGMINDGEFAVVLKCGNNPEIIANEILEAVRKKVSLVINGTRIEAYVTPYAGVSSFPEDADNPEELIKDADLAMLQAVKKNMTVPYRYDIEIEKYMARQIRMENLIKEGLEKQYFYMVYQPQYALKDKSLRGFESLIRMKTAQGEIVSPGDFIPIAEKSELILKIDEFVLRRVMQDFKELVKKNPSLVVSVNVSAKNIGKEDFVPKVGNILEELEFPANNLEIEITEYCMVESVETTIHNISKLREMGVFVALDDFGTGYSSLSYLSKMPINLLKIDRSLVEDIEENEKIRDFVNAVISMGHLMGCEVISEGVETKTQIEVLAKQNCDFVQGYVWGKPMDYLAAKELCRK